MDFMKQFDVSGITGAGHRATGVALAEAAFRVSNAPPSPEADAAKAALMAARVAVDALYGSPASPEPVRWR